MKAPVETLGGGTGAEMTQANGSTDLFPDTLPPILPAYWPTPGSRADEALQALISGPQNQADYHHGWRLAAYIKELEYDGWSFRKRDILKPGCRRAIREYTLNRQVPAIAIALKTRGR